MAKRTVKAGWLSVYAEFDDVCKHLKTLKRADQTDDRCFKIMSIILQQRIVDELGQINAKLKRMEKTWNTH